MESQVAMLYPRVNFACCKNVREPLLFRADAGESDPVTTLVVGSSLNVSYHLAYPHRVSIRWRSLFASYVYSYLMLFLPLQYYVLQGGIRINILDSNGTIVHALLGLDSWRLEDDST